MHLGSLESTQGARKKAHQTLPIVMVRIFKNNAAFVSFVLFYNTRLFQWGIVKQHSAFSRVQSKNYR